MTQKRSAGVKVGEQRPAAFSASSTTWVAARSEGPGWWPSPGNAAARCRSACRRASARGSCRRTRRWRGCRRRARWTTPRGLLHHGHVFRVQVPVAAQPREGGLDGKVPESRQRRGAVLGQGTAHRPNPTLYLSAGYSFSTCAPSSTASRGRHLVGCAATGHGRSVPRAAPAGPRRPASAAPGSAGSAASPRSGT